LERYSGKSPRELIAASIPYVDLQEALQNQGLSARGLSQRSISTTDDHSLLQRQGKAVIYLTIPGTSSPTEDPGLSGYQLAPYAGPHNNQQEPREEPEKDWIPKIQKAFKSLGYEPEKVLYHSRHPNREYYQFEVVLPAALDVVGEN
jgi:hypothetical protein